MSFKKIVKNIQKVAKVAMGLYKDQKEFDAIRHLPTWQLKKLGRAKKKRARKPKK